MIVHAHLVADFDPPRLSFNPAPNKPRREQRVSLTKLKGVRAAEEDPRLDSSWENKAVVILGATGKAAVVIKGPGITAAMTVGLSVASASEISVRPIDLVGGAPQQLCPLCDVIFTELEHFVEGVGRVVTRERGEPKSGTGFMMNLTASALLHACDYLKRTYGGDSCYIRTTVHHDAVGDLDECTLWFEPKRVNEGARCTCDSIEM